MRTLTPLWAVRALSHHCCLLHRVTCSETTILLLSSPSLRSTVFLIVLGDIIPWLDSKIIVGMIFQFTNASVGHNLQASLIWISTSLLRPISYGARHGIRLNCRSSHQTEQGLCSAQAEGFCQSSCAVDAMAWKTPPLPQYSSDSTDWCDYHHYWWQRRKYYVGGDRRRCHIQTESR